MQKKKQLRPKVTKYELTKTQEMHIVAKLKGIIGWRELARRILCSPQQAINLTAGVAVQWIIEGRLVLTEK